MLFGHAGFFDFFVRFASLHLGAFGVLLELDPWLLWVHKTPKDKHAHTFTNMQNTHTQTHRHTETHTHRETHTHTHTETHTETHTDTHIPSLCFSCALAISVSFFHKGRGAGSAFLALSLSFSCCIPLSVCAGLPCISIGLQLPVYMYAHVHGICFTKLLRPIVECELQKSFPKPS